MRKQSTLAQVLENRLQVQFQLVDKLLHTTIVNALPVDFLAVLALPEFIVVFLGKGHQVLFNGTLMDPTNWSVAVHTARERSH